MANPFQQMKDLWKMQKEAREMQKKMKAIKISGLSDNQKIEVIIDGSQDLQDIFIDDEMVSAERKSDLIRGLREAFKDAQKKLQKELMKDMDLDKLKSMLS
jgi:DNA-binding protein YbaB